MSAIALVFKVASGIAFFLGVLLLLYQGAFLPDTPPVDLFSRFGTSIRMLSDAIIMMIGAMILFGMGHTFTLIRVNQQKPYPVQRQKPPPKKLSPPETSLARVQRRDRFPNDEAFAQYVAFILSGTGHYSANPDGNRVQLTKDGRVIGLCMCVLIGYEQFVPYNTYERALKLKRDHDLNIFIIATTGMFDVSVQVAARERGVRLLDGDTLRRLETKHKFRDLLAN